MKVKYLIVLAVSVILFAAAVIGYKFLSENYSPDETDSAAAFSETVSVSENPQTVSALEKTTEQSGYAVSSVTEDIAEETSAEAISMPASETLTEETVTETVLELQTADFTVYDKDGQPVKLSDFLGKPVVVNFWATWCEPCVEELPLFEELYKEYGNDTAFLMVSLPVGGNSEKKVKEFMKDNKYTFPVYYDTEYSASEAYGIRAVPQSLFITARGELAGSHTGALSEEKLKEYFDLIYS